VSDSTDAEFATMATWTADAVDALGTDHALPAACRGSGSPAGLSWLLERLGVASDQPLLDVGAGVGGPAAFARATVGAVPLAVEPMHDANEAGRRLFGLDSLTGSAEHLPIRSGSVRHAWALGVLSTADDPRAALREAARVLGPDGRLGLLVYLRAARHLDDEPSGTHFLAEDQLAEHLGAAGFDVADHIPLAGVDDPPSEWTDRATAAEVWIEEHHRDEDAWAEAHESETAIGRLLRDQLVIAQLLVVRPTYGGVDSR
jgi:SAM-dependent methyltransferase